MSDIGIFGASEATSKPLPGLSRRTSLSAAGSVVLAPPGARGSKLAALKAAFKQQRAGSDALRARCAALAGEPAGDGGNSPAKEMVWVAPAVRKARQERADKAAGVVPAPPILPVETPSVTDFLSQRRVGRLRRAGRNKRAAAAAAAAADAAHAPLESLAGNAAAVEDALGLAALNEQFARVMGEEGVRMLAADRAREEEAGGSGGGSGGSSFSRFAFTGAEGAADAAILQTMDDVEAAAGRRAAAGAAAAAAGMGRRGAGASTSAQAALAERVDEEAAALVQRIDRLREDFHTRVAPGAGGDGVGFQLHGAAASGGGSGGGGGGGGGSGGMGGGALGSSNSSRRTGRLFPPGRSGHAALESGSTSRNHVATSYDVGTEGVAEHVQAAAREREKRRRAARRAGSEARRKEAGAEPAEPAALQPLLRLKESHLHVKMHDTPPSLQERLAAAAQGSRPPPAPTAAAAKAAIAAREASEPSHDRMRRLRREGGALALVGAMVAHRDDVGVQVLTSDCFRLLLPHDSLSTRVSARFSTCCSTRTWARRGGAAGTWRAWRRRKGS